MSTILIVFGRPFVKRFALCYQSVVCLSCLYVCPVCDIRALWPNGWTDQGETWHAARTRPCPLCVRWGPRSPIFGPYLLQPNGWMDQDATWYGGRRQPRRLCVRWGPRSTLPKNGGQCLLPNFRPISIAVKWLQHRCMHQDATWYGGRPQPRGLRLRWEPRPPKFSTHVYYSYCDFVRTLHKAQSLLIYSSSSFIFCAFYF